MTERDIFLALLDLPDPAARAAHLDGACAGNAELRARVEGLLRSHADAGDFLGTPAFTIPDLTQDLAGGPEGKCAEDALTFLASPRRPDSLGRIGHYEALEVLGRGGFGIVIRAFDEVLHRVVALKVLSPQLAATSPPRKRFLREARSSAQIRHQNVVQVYAVEEQPLPYLVMEFIPGETLQERLDRTGPLEVSEIVEIGRQIAQGLAAAHEKGLIHRDIKPGNILIEAGPQPHVKITDFGLARAADDASLTQSGVVAGTPMYMSPEQAKGEHVDHRTDLFSLGSVLYTMASGRPPFRAPNTLAVLKRVAEDTPRPIGEIIPETPQWLCDVITKLHEKDPEDRFGSAREVADRLAGLQQHGGAPASQASLRPRYSALRTPERVPPVRRARRWAVAAILVLLLLGFVITEATDVTNIRWTVIRLFSPDGTLVVEVDDPRVSVTVDGEDMVISGTGAKEIRLKPGMYKVQAARDGKIVKQELVTVTRNGRQVVRVSREAEPAAAAWERSVAALPADQQVKAVIARLKELNPEFKGEVRSTIEKGVVTGLEFTTENVTDISPVRALTGLKSLSLGNDGTHGKLSDLSPLRGMALTRLNCINTAVSDLSPLRGLPLTFLNCHNTKVSDLSPLKGVPLEFLACGCTQVTDLTPLTGMPLTTLNFDHNGVSDLSPLRGMKLTVLSCGNSQVADLSPLQGMALQHVMLQGTRVTDLSVLKGMPLEDIGCDFKAERDAEILRSFTTLKSINYKPAAEFWMEVGQK